MKMPILAIMLSLIAMPATAQCIGSDTLKTCRDDSGNTYTVTNMGSMTTVQGSNARTGSTWNQQTTRSPGMSITNGRDSDGRSWNSTTTQAGTFGRDADGNSFYRPRR